MDELPCSHAMAVVGKMKLNCYDYCSRYYFKETMLATYKETVYHIENPNTWIVPEDVKERKEIEPKEKHKSRRPKKRRIQSKGEHKVKLKCGRCGEYGHNRQTCRNPPPVKKRKTRAKEYIERI